MPRGAGTTSTRSGTCWSRSPSASGPSTSSTSTTCCCSGGPWPVPREAAGVVAGAFDHVLVDEYQDTNALQADILDALCPDGRGLTVVGDDAQAIYGFRAATPRNILDFASLHPGTTVVTLAANHRSTPPIIGAANAVMAAAAPGHASGKVLTAVRPGARRPLLRTCYDEAAQAARGLRRGARPPRRGRRPAPAGGAVPGRLARRPARARAHPPQRPLREVRRAAVPRGRPREGPAGPAPAARQPVGRAGVGPRPQAARRRRADHRGAPGGGARRAGPGRHLGRLAPRPAARRGAGRAGGGSCGARRAARRRWATASPSATEPAPQVERLRRFLEPIVRHRYDSADARLEDLAQVEAAARRYGTRAALLTDLTLDPPQSTGDLAGPPGLDEDWLTLSTVHSAKGGEWDVVHVIHLADGCFPSDMATGSVEELEEERRLLYVAVHPRPQRARAELAAALPPQPQAPHRQPRLGPAVTLPRARRAGAVRGGRGRPAAHRGRAGAAWVRRWPRSTRCSTISGARAVGVR